MTVSSRMLYLLILSILSCLPARGEDAGEPVPAAKEQALAGMTRADAPDGYLRQGDAHLLAGQYDRALAAYRAALVQRPGSMAALEKLADAQMAAGHDEEAVRLYRQLLAADGSRSGISYPLGLLYERQGMLDEAETQFRQAVRHRPGEARRHLADIYTLRGNYAQAAQQYRELLLQRPDNPLLHFKLARVYLSQRDHPAAIAEYLETIRLAPGTIEAHRELAALYLKKGNRQQAAAHYRAVLHQNEQDLPARSILTALYLRMHKYDDLLLLLKRGAELFPDDPDSHFKLGLMHDFRKEYDASVSRYRRALALKGDHGKALKGLGKVYLKLGEHEQARKYLLAAKRADPKLPGTDELLNELRRDRDRAARQKRVSEAARKKGEKQLKKGVAARSKKSVGKNGRGKKKKRAGTSVRHKKKSSAGKPAGMKGKQKGKAQGQARKR